MIHSTKVHRTKASYASGVAARFKKPAYENMESGARLKGAPVATDGVVHFSGEDEYRTLEKDGEHARISGKLFLGPVQHPSYSQVTTDPIVPIGSRLLLTSLSPDGLGGRLALLAKEFQQHKIIQARLTYVAATGSQANGQLALFFTNDTGTSGAPTGTDEFSHSTALNKGISFKLWDDCHLNFRPSLSLKKYTDDPKNPLNSTGLIYLETATMIDFTSTHTASGLLPVGNLFLDYEYEFYNASLSYNVQTRETHTISLTASAAQTPIGDYLSVLGITEPTGSAGPTTISNILSSTLTLPSDVANAGELQSRIFVGFSTFVRNSATGTVTWPMYDPSLGSTISFGVGQGVYIRVFPISTGTWIGKVMLVLFTNFSDAASYEHDETAGLAVSAQSYQFMTPPFGALAANTETVSFSGTWSVLE